MPERLNVDDEPRYECTSGPCAAGLGVFAFGQVAAPGLGLYVGCVEKEWTEQSELLFAFVLLSRPLRDSGILPATGVVGRAWRPNVAAPEVLSELNELNEWRT